MTLDSEAPLFSRKSEQPKQILYVAPTNLQYRRWMADIQRVPGGELVDERYPPLLLFQEITFSWVVEQSPKGTMERLRSMYASMLLLDLRYAPEPDDRKEGIKQARQLLAQLDEVEDLESRYGFHRILALVSGPVPEQVDQLMVELGGFGIQHVIRQRVQSESGIPNETESVAFAANVLEYIVTLLSSPQQTKTALCLAGGGITGIYYELGALKCLDDCLISENKDIPAINNFDMYFGISAGAVNSGVLSAGYAVEEFMAALDGHDGGRIEPLSLNLMKLEHLNFSGYLERLRFAFRSSWHGFRGAFSSKDKLELDSFVLNYSEILGPPFRSDLFEQVLRKIFSMDGVTNDFRQLPRCLYIGASDQDKKRHVLFGSTGYRDVPISKAIQASLSIHPAFAAVKINGRYYEDGAVTRTSNMTEAIRRGASLVFVLDPFLPYVAREVGYTHKRGLLYNLDQDIRTLSYTRYENVRNWALRKHPDVRSYTFVPSNRLRHLLSDNPMDHRPFLEIWRGAYLSTYRRIKGLLHRLRGDATAHNLGIDLDRASEVTARLKRTESVRFEDFFPDGKIHIRKPPLACEQHDCHEIE